MTVTLPPGPTLLGLALRLADPLAVRVAVAVTGPALVGEAATVEVGPTVGWGAEAPRVVVSGLAVLVGWLVLVLAGGARVAVLLAWLGRAVAVGVRATSASAGASSAVANGAGEDRQA